MFFSVFLLTTVFAKISSGAIAEEDFYNGHSSDEYEDYEYNDEVINVASGKSTVIPVQKTKTTSEINENSFETDKPTKVENLGAIVNIDNVKNIKTSRPGNKDFAAPLDYNDDEDTHTYKPIEGDSKSYEVTEIVDDIPNNVTFRPIITNFTIKLPLNNATGNVNNSSNTSNNMNGFFNFLYNHVDKNNDKDDVDVIKSSLKKNKISIFHVNAEFDDDKDKKPAVQNIHINKIPFGIFNIKDNVDKIKDDVYNYGHSTEGYDDDLNQGYFLHNILEAPLHILRKLRAKGSALWHSIF